MAVEALRDQERGEAEPGQRQGRLDAGVPRADHDGVIVRGRPRARAHAHFPTQNRENIRSSISAVVTAPVISPSASSASARSTARRSGGDAAAAGVAETGQGRQRALR